ncbi:MAG TPA: SGNH/GDSL hydrolase family protein, partial [Isosphaeraceae bacterium]|nr:SGNH/GDSL hydrolase family protein [Isosphaeraceae bacterium]
ENLPLWLSSPGVHRRSRWERALRRIVRPRPVPQRVFAFVDRARRLDRFFKLAIAGLTLGLLVVLLAALPAGRYLAGWLATHGRWTAYRMIGLEPERDEIDAEWQRKRDYDVASARAQLAGTFAAYDPPQQRLLRFAGMDPDHVLLRWGNFDRTVMLPATVFEPDESGRSYRFRPNTRSIWIRNFPTKGAVKAYFQVPDTPEAAELVKGTGAAIVAESAQTTNSWGLRGPEPNLEAPFRGIALGDSYMQGLFVGDDQTPTECLKRDLAQRLGAAVEILNTGHLGYSPEQYYYSLVEYAQRFPPQFVVVSIFANDFDGDWKAVLEGRGGDWPEGKFWLGRIRQFCAARGVACLFVPAPWVNQLDGPQLAGFYPGAVSNILETTGFEYLDPINEFSNALLALSIDGLKRGEPISGNPLFNGRIGDGHFSAQGCVVWAEVVGRRLGLLVDLQLAKTGLARPLRRLGPRDRSWPGSRSGATPRSP